MKKRTIELALQGGGSHGAVTWGVLDRLLEDGTLDIEGISGTSAGAMNAVVLADGLARGGRDGARERLHHFWQTVSKAAENSPLQRTFWDKWTGNWNLDNSPVYLMMDALNRVLSPYDINPMDFNPLRDIVAAEIDFDRVNAASRPKVFVTATNVRSGRARIFTQGELSVESLMASAALPFMFKAVEIDGEAYWDGGYSGNPALYPLVYHCDARDLVLVQINPFYRDAIPRSARDIINRMNEITFNASLIKELRVLLLIKNMVEEENLQQDRYKDMRLHCIHSDEDLENLSPSSKLNAEWAYLTYLRDLGRAQAERWLVTDGPFVGERTTFDIGAATRDSSLPVRMLEEDDTAPKNRKKEAIV